MLPRIPVQLVLSRVAAPHGQFIDMHDDTITYLDIMKIDTFSVLTPARMVDHSIPRSAKTVIRYEDRMNGYRVFYVKDSASHINRAIFRAIGGEDPGSIDFGEIPNGI